MTAYSPLRYPGGKGKLAGYVSEILKLNDLISGHYVEPFAGGAAVALDLLFSEKVSEIHINDLDYCVYSFWYCAIFENEKLIDKIEATPVNIETWLWARDIWRNPKSFTQFEVGFATFFLSRTNRSGILNGGVIGGLNQDGNWKIDCRYNKDELKSRIYRIGFYRSRINLSNLDAYEFIKGVSNIIPNNSLIYLDPPYYVKGAYLYENHFDHEDHKRISEIIKKVNSCSWIVSYDHVAEISDLYKDYDQESFGIDYSARNYARGRELMIFSPGLVRPVSVFTNARERSELALI